MKKIVFLLLFAILLYSCSNNDKSWETTVEANTIEAYQIYIKENPEGEHFKLANTKLDSLVLEKDASDFQKAFDENTSEAILKYKEEHPAGAYLSNADEKLKILLEKEKWVEVENKKSVKEFYDYLQEYPNNKYYYRAKFLTDSILKTEFEDKYSAITDFFEVVAKDQSFNTLSKYIDGEISYSYAFPMTETFICSIVDSASYAENSFAHLLSELEKNYNNYGFYSDEMEYELDYIPDGLGFAVKNGFTDAKLIFTIKNNALYLTEVLAFYP